MDAPSRPATTCTPACHRALQAEGAWRLLGGDGELRKPETYLLRYVPQVHLLWLYLLWPYSLWLHSPSQPGAEFGADGKMKGTAGATAGSARAITGTDGRSYFGALPRPEH